MSLKRIDKEVIDKWFHIAALLPDKEQQNHIKVSIHEKEKILLNWFDYREWDSNEWA